MQYGVSEYLSISTKEISEGIRALPSRVGIIDNPYRKLIGQWRLIVLNCNVERMRIYASIDAYIQ